MADLFGETVHLVTHVEKPSIRTFEVFTAVVEHDANSVSLVATTAVTDGAGSAAIEPTKTITPIAHFVRAASSLLDSVCRSVAPLR